MNRDHALVFYDGDCGLCHRAVKFALHHDPDGSRFRFAPLQGSTLQRELAAEVLDTLSDSIVVLTKDGTVLQRSDATLLMLDQIGGGWATLGHLSSLVPRSLRDLVYRGVAKTRHRLFQRPDEVCPVVPEALRRRFLP